MDAGFEVFLYGTGEEISYNGEVIIRGWQVIPTRIWRISLLPDGYNNIIPPNSNIIDEEITQDIPTLLTNSIFECDNAYQLIQYYYATMGYPIISTWWKAIHSGYFQGCPRLTSEKVRHHIKVTTEKYMGHMEQQR